MMRPVVNPLLTSLVTGGLLAGISLLSVQAAPRPASPKTAPAGTTDAGNADFFESKVRPVLAAQCFKCHGPAKQLGSLRVDSREALLKGGDRGPALVLGKPEKSLLLQAVRHQGDAPQMPPSGSLKPGEIEALSQWVQRGAAWPAYSAEAEQRSLWSLKPVHRPAVPALKDADGKPSAWVRNPIDAFVLQGLRGKKLTPAPAADRATLLRRIYFDMVGLPPSAEEIQSFVDDRAPDAYEKVVDRLLASPRYGERWARYWLDLVRYADSNGYERDEEKRYSWKYRDYVIKCLNEDRPYNRFVLEQLAGDELPNRTEETVAATGFLRIGTWDDEPNDPLEYKYERLDDLVHAAGTTFLGLTVKCARCHDHKFDPIPQKDYYAFAAAFYGGYLEPAERELMGGPPPDKLGFQVLGFTDRGPTVPALHRLKNGDSRHEEEEVGPGFLSAVGPLGHQMLPPAPDAATTGRRRQLAEWIVDPKNPLTARVMVNRLWQHHFGEGIVRSPNNFGRTGDLPTHPELLDWLSASFVSGDYGSRTPNTEHRTPWSLKALHRTILLSSTYRMASNHPKQAEYAQQDFGNHFLWRQNRRRLDADALRDAMLTVSGELNPRMGGRGFVPTVSSEALEGLSRKGAEWMPSRPDEQRRRTIYMFLKRALVMPLLTTFDFGDTTAPLGQRDVTIVPTQALTLLNNQFVHQRAEGLAGLIESKATTPEERVEQAWRLALGRTPSPAERSAAVAHLKATEAEAVQARRRPVAESDLPTGARLWLRSDRDVTADAEGRVQRWGDPATGMAAAPPQPGTAPLLVKDALSGRPVLRFDGKGRYLHLPEGLLTSQQFTIVAVANDRESGGGHREIFSNWRREDNIGPAVFFGLTGPSQVRLTDFFAPAGTVETPSKHFVLTAVSDRAGATVYQNRKELARKNGPLPPRNLSGRYVIGQQGNIQGEYWNGDLAELLVFDRALSAEELDRVWDWTAQRYEIGGVTPPQRQALASLCRVLLNTNEFCFVD